MFDTPFDSRSLSALVPMSANDIVITIAGNLSRLQVWLDCSLSVRSLSVAGTDLTFRLAH